METRSHVNPDCLCPHSVPYSERSLSFAANVHRPAWLTLQNCGLLKSVLWQEKRTQNNDRDELCRVGQVIWGQCQFCLGTKVWLNTILGKCFT